MVTCANATIIALKLQLNGRLGATGCCHWKVSKLRAPVTLRPEATAGPRGCRESPQAGVAS